MSQVAVRAEWPVVLRPMKDEDLDFVRPTWEDSLYRERPWSAMRRRDFNEGHRKLMRRLLERSAARVLATAPAGEPKFGWVLCDHNLVHYVYVRGMFRRSGIGTLLLTEGLRLAGMVDDATRSDLTLSCKTRDWKHLRERFPSRYNPFLALDP